MLSSKQVLPVFDILGDLEVELCPSVAQPGHGKTIVRICLYAHLVDFKPVTFALVGRYVGNGALAHVGKQWAWVPEDIPHSEAYGVSCFDGIGLTFQHNWIHDIDDQ